MNNLQSFIIRNKKTFGLFAVFVVIFILITLMKGTDVVNPASNKTDPNPRAGKDYALIYNHGQLYGVINSSDENLRAIQEDLALFARTTRPEFKNPDSLVGFTLDKKFNKDNDQYTFTGHFYSVKDDIKLLVNVFDKGVIRLSVTNLKDGTNIDELLGLNGPKNKLLEALPIETDTYSIRYLNSSDKVIVTFYQGYARQDVDTVVTLLKKEYGDKYQESDFTFSINSIGIFTLQEVINNLTNPIPPR